MIAHPQATPRELHAVVDFLIPELRHGRFRTEYEGRTLPGDLGIPPVDGGRRSEADVPAEL